MSKEYTNKQIDQCVPAAYRWTLVSSEIEKLLLKKNNYFIQEKYEITLTKKVSAYFLFVCILSFFSIFYLYLKQFFIIVNRRIKIESVILDTGRGYDCNNVYKLFKIKNDKTYLINAFSIDSYMQYERVGIFNLTKNLINSIYDYKVVLKMGFSSDIVDILVKNGLTNLSTYTYLKTFFEEIRNKNPNSIIYTSTALIQSHAAILSNLKTVNIYHGLIGKVCLNIYPEYYSIYVYSFDEKRYFENIGVTSKVYVYPAIKNKLHNKNVILFMADDASRVDSKELSDLIYQFKLHGHSIFMKMHPLHNASREFKSEYEVEDIVWNNIFDTSELEILSGEDATFVLKEKQPSFVVGWHSTALCEALNSNVIPIMMSDTTRDNSLGVYPSERRSLLWPVECNTINNLISNYSSYEDTIYMLKTR